MIKNFRKDNLTVALCKNAVKTPIKHINKACNECSLKNQKQPNEVLICTSNPKKYNSLNPPPEPQQTADMLVTGLTILAFLADIAFQAYKRYKQSKKPTPAKPIEEEEWL